MGDPGPHHAGLVIHPIINRTRDARYHPSMFTNLILGWGISALGFLLVIALCCTTLWRALAKPLGAGKAASCGSCGYELNTVGPGVCSECGANLLKAGIVTSRMVLAISGSVASAVLAWTILCMIAVGVAIAVLGTIAMSRAFAAGGIVSGPITGTVGFNPAPYSDPNTQAFINPTHEFLFKLNTTTDPNTAAVTGTVDLEARINNRTVATATITADDGSVVVVDADGNELASEESFTTVSADALFTALGVDMTLPGSTTERSQLVTLAAESVINPVNLQSVLYMNYNPNQVGGLNPGVNTMNFAGLGGAGPFAGGDDWWVSLAVFGTGGVVWAGGLIFLLVRRAKVIEGSRPTQPAAA